EGHQRHHQQHRHHRPLDEGGGNLHGGAPLFLPPFVTRTAWPGVTRNWPSVTTLSPGLTAPWMASLTPSSFSTLTVLELALPSLPTTSTKLLSGPRLTASRGTTVAPGI